MAAATYQTLDQMVATIASDMTRTNQAANIRQAILEAILEIQIQRFWFNEVQGVTFSTVEGQADYDLTTLLGVSIDDFIELDWIRTTINGSPRRLMRQGNPSQIDLDVAWNTLSGEPTEFNIYGGVFRLYPIPQSVYTVSLAGHFKAPPLSSGDQGEGNVWMTYGKGNDMIRRQATARVYTSPIKNFDMAAKYSAMAGTAIEVAKLETDKRKRTGNIRPLRGGF